MKIDKRKFAELIDDNQGIIIKISRMYTDTTADEEDLFQEIVLQLWKSIDSFKGDSKFSTWMYRVALNTAIGLFRKKTRSINQSELKSYHEGVEDDNEYWEREEKISELFRAIKQLSEMERAICMMYLDEIPYKEISENLGITEVNARVKMNRIKSKLKIIMEQNG